MTFLTGCDWCPSCVQELFPEYDIEEEQKVVALIDQHQSNWGLGPLDDQELDEEEEREDFVTELMEESDPELRDLWPSDDIPLTKDMLQHKRRVSFLEPERYRKRYGNVSYGSRNTQTCTDTTCTHMMLDHTHSRRRSVLKRLSLLREKRKPSLDSLGSLAAGKPDVLTSDQTKRLAVSSA